MGGDLIDVISTREGGLLVYIADISGHGLPAGQLMGMLKAAMRMAFQFQHTPASLLESADRVLPAVKTISTTIRSYLKTTDIRLVHSRDPPTRSATPSLRSIQLAAVR
jgi:Stage II sporulation protein E (SpoIIE)